MTLEATPIQPALDAGQHALSPGDAANRATRDGSTSPSTLTHCIAWLFGLEAFLREPAERDRP